MEEVKINLQDKDNMENLYPVIDSHIHLLDYTEFQLEIILENASKANVKHIMNNCCVEQDFIKIQSILKKYKDNFILNSYGLHPWWLNQRSPNWLQNLREYLEKDPNSQVGEIGLDQLKYEQTSKEEQIDILEKQLELGIELDRVISVHCVRAQPEMQKVFKKYFKDPKQKPVNIIMHSYSGNKEMTKGYLKLHANIYFSLSQGIIRKPEFLQVIPLDNILVESDGPHQLCEKEVQESGLFSEKDFLVNQNHLLPKLGKINEPKFCHALIEFLAKLHNKSRQEITLIVYNNSLKAFRLIK
ncbi:hypothetical protein ABPG72_008381 [Tetrahymena utriculariae]